MTEILHPQTNIRQHVLWPMIGFGLFAFVLELTHADLLLADKIYELSGGTWVLRDAWLTSVFVHEGGRQLMTLLAVGLLLVTAASLKLQFLQPYRRTLTYLLTNMLLAELVITLLKQATHVDCPWDLWRYGGEFAYVGIFTHHPGTFRYGACFPAGHASAAYAWFGLYFAARIHRPGLRVYVLGGVILTGLVFGITQQLRGAHFISHDLWTIAICWLTATLTYLGFFPNRRHLDTHNAYL